MSFVAGGLKLFIQSKNNIIEAELLVHIQEVVKTVLAARRHTNYRLNSAQKCYEAFLLLLYSKAIKLMPLLWKLVVKQRVCYIIS